MVKLKMTSNILKWTSPSNKMSRNQQAQSVTSNNGANNVVGISPGVNIGGGGGGGGGAGGGGRGHHNPATKRWIHDDTSLVNGHVAYVVKFLGNVEVDQPKGLEVVKESIRKLEFQEHLKRSEGEKIKRIELTISIDGVAIREPKTKHNIHQFPLHRISYCADDKSERRYLSFISKVQEGSDRHECFVFVSDKSSEEITLTIGQAFELAYRKFLDASGRDFDTKKELVQARKKIQELERKVTELEQKLQQNENPQRTHQQHFQTPPVSPTTNQTIDLTLATSRLQSLIDLP